MRFFWDTNLFIYLLDATGQFRNEMVELRKGMIGAGIGVVTSTMTLGELQVGPRRSGNDALALGYKSAVSQVAQVVSFDEPAADHYAFIRQKTEVKGPDAIQLACAAAQGVELFVTNDKQLHRLRIPGINFIVPIETALTLIP